MRKPDKPLLAGRADDEVRIGLPGRVQVVGDVLDLKRLGELGERRPLLRLLGEQRSQSVTDLVATAVRDRDVHDHPRVRLGARARGPDPVGDVVGEQLERSDGTDLPALRLRQLLDQGGDDVQERLELLVGFATEVLGREHPQRDEGEPDFVAPVHELLELRGAGAVARDECLPRRVEARPAPVAVRQNRDVLGKTGLVELGDQPLLVRAVQKACRVQPVQPIAKPFPLNHGNTIGPIPQWGRGGPTEYAEPTVP